MAHKSYTALEYSGRLLGIRSYSCAALKKKLLEKLYPGEEVERVIALLVANGFLNDERLASDLCASLLHGGTGRGKIIQKLRAKMIPREIMDDVLEEAFRSETGNERAAAEKALSLKRNALLREPDLRKRRDKALRMLAFRGFSSRIAFEVLGDSGLFS